MTLARVVWRTSALIIAVFLLASEHTARAGINVWTTNGPEGGPVRALALDPATPTTLYAGIYDNGVFKSLDGGVTWRATGGLTRFSDIGALAIDPTTATTIYAGTSESGVLKSLDGGDTWNPTAPLNYGETSIKSLAIDPTTPATVYAGSHDSFSDFGNLVKSTDGGGHWLDTALFLTPVVALAIDPNQPKTLYASDPYGVPDCSADCYGVLKSTDGGDTWRQILVEYVSVLAIDPIRPTTLYAGTYGKGVLKSTDGGRHWGSLGTGLDTTAIDSLAIDPIAPTTVYAGTFGRGMFTIQQVAGCLGDCNIDGQVTADEVLAMVSVDLGTSRIAGCPAGDANHDNEITVDEIIAAVHPALSGCAG